MPIDERKQNTAALQEKFKDVYQKFFASNDLVVSADITVNYATGYSWRAGAPSVKHKLPFRSYLGLKPNNQSGEITVGNMTTYYSANQCFGEIGYNPLNWEKCIPYLKQMIKEETGQEDFTGVKIDFLCEKPDDTGFDSPVAFSVIAALFLFYNLVTSEQIKQIPSLSGEEIDKQETDIGKLYRKMFIEANKLISLTFCGQSSGADSYAGILESRLPITTFSDERAGTVDEPFPGLPVLDVGDDVTTVDQMKTWCMRMNEISDVEGDLPLDLVLINPGSTREYSASSEYVNKVVIPGFNELQSRTEELFSKLNMDGNGRLPHFMKNLDVKGRFWQDFAQGNALNRLQFLFNILALYKYRYRTAEIQNFLENIEYMMMANGAFEESPSTNLRRIMREIRNRAYATGNSVGIRAIFWGKQDGSVMVFSPPGKFREEIFEVVEQMRNELNPKIHVEFASWRDGFGTEGMKVEQFLSNNNYSNLLDRHARNLTIYEPQSGLNTNVCSESEIDRTKFDLLIDKINDKIYIRGEEFTSKEIPSQKATVAILDLLLKHVKQPMTNKELPKSGYTEYRNEMQGKIVTPINKLLKDRLGHESGIKIAGQLMNFEICFDPDTMTVAIVEKI